jgi:hypothetical protein
MPAPLGRTGLDVTALGYGAMEIRGPRIWSGRDLSDDQAERILNAVLDAGINFIDTAYDYGRSEEYIGRFIGHRRNEYYLATKCGCTVVDAGDHDETPHVWTRENITARLEESLRRDHHPGWRRPRCAGRLRTVVGRPVGDLGQGWSGQAAVVATSLIRLYSSVKMWADGASSHYRVFPVES